MAKISASCDLVKINPERFHVGRRQNSLPHFAGHAFFLKMR